MSNCQFFGENILFAVTLTWPKTVFNKKHLFSKQQSIKLKKNASNRRKVQICHETKLFFQ